MSTRDAKSRIKRVKMYSSSCMKADGTKAGLEILFPSLALCTDNAAMIACAGFYRLDRGERTPFDSAADPGLALGAADTLAG